MTEEPIRKPTTPEEIEFFRRGKQIAQRGLIISFVFYILIFLIVPKIPDNSFYLQLDNFLNTHLLGDIMPEFSPNFYFTMKVAWCLSLPYTLFRFFIMLLIFHIRLTPKGVSTSLYLHKYDTFTTGQRTLLSFLVILTVLACLFLSISPYAFQGDEALTVLKSLNSRFYGNFFAAKLLFLFLQVLLISMGIHLLTFYFYHAVFCKGDLRL